MLSTAWLFTMQLSSLEKRSSKSSNMQSCIGYRCCLLCSGIWLNLEHVKFERRFGNHPLGVQLPNHCPSKIWYVNHCPLQSELRELASKFAYSMWNSKQLLHQWFWTSYLALTPFFHRAWSSCVDLYNHFMSNHLLCIVRFFIPGHHGALELWLWTISLGGICGSCC